MKVTLKINTKGLVKEHSLELNGILSIGRSSQCNALLDDSKISGKHCHFHLKKDRLEIHDLDSKNGTYLNGIRIDRSEVFLGDEVLIGDSVISLVEHKMHPEAVDVLTFPGPFKDRISYELKADFTGARIQNQLNNKKSPSELQHDPSHAREIGLRRRAKSNIRLSKQEIRTSNKFLSFSATLIDGLLTFTALCLPIIFSSKLIPSQFTKQQSLLLLGVAMVFTLVGFFILNFKKMKFSLGERVSGIKELYDKQ